MRKSGKFECVRRIGGVVVDGELWSSKLISPCKCKGSSLYIHTHCLESWQRSALESNRILNAIRCQVCNSSFSHPTWFQLIVLAVKTIICHWLDKTCQLIKSTFLTIALQPLKRILHTCLIIVTLPWGQLSLGNLTLAWIGNEFPPRLALITSDDTCPEIVEGMLLVASPNIPKESIFYQTVVLLLEYSPTLGGRGVILNREYGSHNNSRSRPRELREHSFGFGGPVDRFQITVIHDCCHLAHESSFTCLSESVFVTECESGRRSLSQQLSGKLTKLINLYRSTARKAHKKLQECTTVATAYAARAKDSLTCAILSTHDIISRASQTSVISSSSVPSTPIVVPVDIPGSGSSAIVDRPVVRPHIRSHESTSFQECKLALDATGSATPSSSNVCVYKGGVRWNPMQLDGEFKQGFWHALPVSHSAVFPADDASHDWWEKLYIQATESLALTEKKADVSPRRNFLNEKISWTVLQ